MELEEELFLDIRHRVAESLPDIFSAGAAIGELDALLSLAESASRHHYTRLTSSVMASRFAGEAPPVKIRSLLIAQGRDCYAIGEVVKGEQKVSFHGKLRW